ncbi:MAG: hypothetical protein OEV40_16370 [Acidimicrobiia bacterium]|nr:hypothetical protein [Acidimicrobiia bacterium]
MLESIGFTVIDYWIVSGGEWHAAVLVEGPDDLSAADAARTTFQQVAAGAIVDGRFLRLARPADVDAMQFDYSAPGR